MRFLHKKFYLIILMPLIVSTALPAVARDYSYMDDHISSDAKQMTLPAETNSMSSQANIIWGSIIDAVATMGVESVNESVGRNSSEIGRFYKAYSEDQLRRGPHYNGAYEGAKYQSRAWNNHKPGSTEWKNQKKWQKSQYKERKKRIKERRKYSKKYQRYYEKNKAEHYRVWKEEQKKRDFEEYIPMLM